LDIALLNGDRGTAWANLGDWSAAESYVDAARAFALRLGVAATLAPGQRIVDAGVGAGEQLLLWPTQFGVAHVTACDQSTVFAALAAARVQRAGLGDRVSVVAAEANELQIVAGSADRVIALDAAYHFADRGDFFQRAAHWLAPEGRLALTDLTLGPAAGRMTSQWARVAGIAPTQLLSADSYRTMVQQAGFTTVQIEDLSAPVLGGFARWTRAQRGRLLRRSPFGAGLSIAITGAVADYLHRSRRVSYVLVTATKAPA
jgi:cyclopropane fatty-acyl-phospholipid synthase-like methyltransferase